MGSVLVAVGSVQVAGGSVWVVEGSFLGRGGFGERRGGLSWDLTGGWGSSLAVGADFSCHSSSVEHMVLVTWTWHKSKGEGREEREVARERDSTEVQCARGAYICLTWKDGGGAKSVRNHCSRRAGSRGYRIYIVSHRNQDKMKTNQTAY